MKLLNTIATAAVISTSLFATAPAEAFWGFKPPTHDQLENENFSMSRNDMKKIYKSEGWIHGSFSGGSWNQLRKIKLVDCKTNVCLYYTKIVDQPENRIFVTVSQVDCSTGKTRSRGVSWGKWMDWGAPFFEEEGKQAYKKFCG